MMRISPSPKVAHGALKISVDGDVLTINSDTLDLSAIVEGAEIPGDLARSLHPMIDGPICREGGELCITLVLPLSPDCTDPWMCFPEPIVVTEDGPVDLPFATYSEIEEQKIDGGTNIITTTKRWRQADTVETVFVPDPPPVEAPGEDA